MEEFVPATGADTEKLAGFLTYFRATVEELENDRLRSSLPRDLLDNFRASADFAKQQIIDVGSRLRVLDAPGLNGAQLSFKLQTIQWLSRQAVRRFRIPVIGRWLAAGWVRRLVSAMASLFKSLLAALGYDIDQKIDRAMEEFFTTWDSLEDWVKPGNTARTGE